MSWSSNPDATPAHIELDRAGHAQAAIDNPLIAAALASWEQEITESWKQSPLRDAAGREHLRLMLEACKHFEAYLTRTLETGKLQQVQLARKLTVLERVRAGWQG